MAVSQNILARYVVVDKVACFELFGHDVYWRIGDQRYLFGLRVW